ncbi:PD-(D/E)XK motif protein [Mesoterricola silvestris]|uniref:PD-(D/E)XK motif protein n=1 Tax=Mesoterricola silvestris TaxID=2927979 RepID=A0AA48GTN6_9BACT|nr:PD-(D/E)XK motif protein [Mesoterricola silvestris]BDU71551.1 hypothetical protein METEAL_07250 [Mesoterricola silvestris]
MKADPWFQISRPASPGQLKALRMHPDHPHEIFRTRDHSGAIGISIAFRDVVSFPAILPRLRGITIRNGNAPAQLLLTLHGEADSDLFNALSEDLARSCAEERDCQAALNAVLGRLDRWQKMLAHDRKGLLTEQEIRGLFGELTFLHEELIPRFGPSAVAFWNGPDGSPQDFAIGSSVVEIKTRAGSGPTRIQISSPEQLWPLLPKLFLGVYYLALVTIPGQGRSLRDLVDLIRTEVDVPGLRETYESRLEAVGYIDLPEYGADSFLPGPLDTYEVRQGFPMIAPGSVPDGVEHVTYAIQLDRCQPFLKAIDWAAIGGQ